jgi:hypothetical protein
MASTMSSAPGTRPATVTYASWLLYLVAALQLIGIPVALLVLGPTRNAVRDVVASDPNTSSVASTIETATTIGVVVGVAFGLLFAAAWVVLGMLDARGKNVARIVTWVLGGVFLCCTGFGLIGNAIGNAFSGLGGNTGGVNQADVQNKINEALPGWYQPVTITLGLVEFLAMLGAVILLALPASNAYFRRPVQQTWEPPLPGSAYPPPPPSG